MEWVLTAISKDRPGIIEDIAAVITKHQGNWVKSSMSRLGGEFAGIVQVTLPAAQAEPFVNELETLSQKGIQISLAKDPTDSTFTGDKTGQFAIIELTGIDHQGIVLDITHMLAANNVSIEEFETGVFSASMAGEPMFHATAKVKLPPNLTVKELHNKAETIAQDIMVDIKLEIAERDQ